MIYGGDIFYQGEYLSVAQFNQRLGITGNSSLLPSFANLGLGNFRLTTADSVARNKGRSFASFFIFDLDYGARPAGSAWDIGAFEQGGAATLVPQAPAALRLRP